tara:strand:+ start:338 stop:925 length:588 start_codon:yes stop_codon:yes gene_type:complete
MNFKTLIQIFLITVILIICGIFYFKYFSKKTTSINNKKIEILKEENTADQSTGNVLKNVEYKSKDENGNSYIIMSEKGEFKDENNNIIFMTKVSATISFKDQTTVNLTSLNAEYNIIDNNTNFYNNVNLDYQDHNVVADNIDIFFKDSKVEAYNNLVYKNLDLHLIADKVQIDLITKNSKIFMFNDKKVKIFKAN